MSGGHFDYAQYRIDDIADSIEREIEAARKPKLEKVWKKGVAVLKIHKEGGRTSKSYVPITFYDYKTAVQYYKARYFEVKSEMKENGLRTALATDLYSGDKYLIREYRWQQYADGKDYPEWTEATLREFEAAVRCLRRAAVYAQRIDWLLSGDDGEEEFHERLEKDLEELDKKQNDQ